MAYQIDQSGKVEQTSWATVVALAGKQTRTLKISATEKRKLIRIISTFEYPKTNYVYRIFATLIFILIRSEKLLEFNIDKEYPSHESVIKDTLIYLFKKKGSTPPQIRFVLVGKKSDAHKAALQTFQGKLKPDKTLKAEAVLKLLYPNKKGWRLHSKRNSP